MNGPTLIGVSQRRYEAGQRIGPYELLRRVGAARNTCDWLARRSDGAFERTLVLRLPAPDTEPDPVVLDAFERDRELLSVLESPHIPRLYDVGSFGNALPYLALEHVEAEPLGAWCDGQRLRCPDRLRLFLQIVETVSYAHARGVFHGDLQLSQVRVNARRQVWILGFGRLAELERGLPADPPAGDDGAAPSRPVTGPAGVRDRAPDADAALRADLRSLGSLLGELIGATPALGAQGWWDGGGRERHSVVRHLRGDAATLRSTSASRLRRAIRGDLDAIVRMALREKAGPDAYPDARALADDVRHFLQGVSVRARPDTPMIRAGRWLRRNRREVRVSAASFAVIVAGFALVTAFQGGWRPGQRIAAPASGTEAVTSVAVLPFADRTPGQDQRFIADGLTEELISRLSRASGLRVIARKSAFQFGAGENDTREVGARLGVSHVIEGSVRRSGDRVRIMVELVRAQDGTRLWSETYERAFADISGLQDEIAHEVAQELAVALHVGPDGGGGGLDPEAYSHLLKGNYYFARVTQSDTEKALAEYLDAVRLDPRFARAWAQIAIVYLRQEEYAWVTSGSVATAARSAARRAVEAEPGLALAHRALGEVLREFEWDWDGAVSEFERAVELEPTDYVLRYRLDDLLVLLGRASIDREVQDLQEAIARDPLDGNSINFLGDLLREAGRFEESSQVFERLIHLNGRFAAVQGNFALVLLDRGRPEQALRMVDGETDPIWRSAVRSCVLWRLGRRADSTEEMQSISVQDPALVAYTLAQVHSCRGETEAAFSWLERAYELRASALVEVRYERLLRPLRSDPRFNRLLARMRLPPVS